MTGFFIALELLFFAPFIVGWIVFLVAAWRFMKAHEEIAKVVAELAGDPVEREEEIRRY